MFAEEVFRVYLCFEKQCSYNVLSTMPTISSRSIHFQDLCASKTNMALRCFKPHLWFCQTSQGNCQSQHCGWSEQLQNVPAIMAFLTLCIVSNNIHIQGKCNWVGQLAFCLDCIQTKWKTQYHTVILNFFTTLQEERHCTSQLPPEGYISWWHALRIERRFSLFKVPILKPKCSYAGAFYAEPDQIDFGLENWEH